MQIVSLELDWSYSTDDEIMSIYSNGKEIFQLKETDAYEKAALIIYDDFYGSGIVVFPDDFGLLGFKIVSFDSILSETYGNPDWPIFTIIKGWGIPGESLNIVLDDNVRLVTDLIYIRPENLKDYLMVFDSSKMVRLS